MIKSFNIDTNTTIPIKYLKLRFINKLEEGFNILFSRVYKKILNISLKFMKIKINQNL